MGGGYPQQGYQTRPHASWGQPGAPQVQQPGFGYMQPGAYPGQSYSQPSYGGYPPQPSSGGYPSNWDQSNASASQQTGQGYDYYNQPAASQQQPTPGGPAASVDSSGYSYSQPPASSYSQQGYAQDGYNGYPQSGYGQPPTYDQQGLLPIMAVQLRKDILLMDTKETLLKHRVSKLMLLDNSLAQIKSNAEIRGDNINI